MNEPTPDLRPWNHPTLPIWERVPPPPPDLRRWWQRPSAAGLAALAAFALLAMVASCEDPTLEPQAPGPATEAATPEPEPAGPGIGDEARDGKFAFTVNRVDCLDGPLEADDGWSDDVAAQGRWCLVDLTVENVGDEPQHLAASAQYLQDADGRRHQASDDLDVFLLLDSPIYERINPGNVTSGVLAFDMPADAVPAAAVLHDSPFSGGVTVRLDGGGSVLGRAAAVSSARVLAAGAVAVQADLAG
jgi:hypothetical protein